MRLVFPFICVLSFLSEPALSQEAGPRQAVERFMNTIRSMEFPPPDEAGHRRRVEQAQALLDLEELSRKSLAEHWPAFEPEKKEAFLDLMRRLIEHVAFPNTSRFIGDYEVEFGEVTISGAGHEVPSVIKQQEQALDAEVIYHVTQDNKIDDVIVDGVSLTEDLQYQFDKILDESGFEGLIEAMENRLAKAKSSEAAAQQRP